MEVTESLINLCKFKAVYGSSWKYWTSVDILWKSYGSYWKFIKFVQAGGSLSEYVEARGSFNRIWSSKLQLMEVMEVSTSTNNGNLYLIPMKLPSTSME